MLPTRHFKYNISRLKVEDRKRCIMKALTKINQEVLKMDGGDCSPTMLMYLMPPNYTVKNV